jgi:hypothetical protein
MSNDLMRDRYAWFAKEILDLDVRKVDGFVFGTVWFGDYGAITEGNYYVAMYDTVIELEWFLHYAMEWIKETLSSKYKLNIESYYIYGEPHSFRVVLSHVDRNVVSGEGAADSEVDAMVIAAEGIFV